MAHWYVRVRVVLTLFMQWSHLKHLCCFYSELLALWWCKDVHIDSVGSVFSQFIRSLVFSFNFVTGLNLSTTRVTKILRQCKRRLKTVTCLCSDCQHSFAKIVTSSRLWVEYSDPRIIINHFLSRNVRLNAKISFVRSYYHIFLPSYAAINNLEDL